VGGKKEAANRRKHNVGFADASTVFGDPLSITIADSLRKLLVVFIL